MLNKNPVQPAARQPRAIVRVNGSPVTGWESWEVTANTYYEADTFRVSFAMSALPATNAPEWWAAQTQIFVEVLAGFPADPRNPTPAELQSLIYGRVDELDMDPGRGVITLTGRDLTAVFIDARFDGEFSNKKSSEIATILAAKHGFYPVVTDTVTAARNYYQRDQVKLQANQSEWDLLTWLAREEGMVCYVSGQELHFEPDTAATGEPYALQWYAQVPGNVQQMSFTRALTVSKGISVTVRSASLRTKVPVVESYPSRGKTIQAGKAAPFGDVQNYYFTLPAGTSPQKCQAYAQARYAEIIAHEMRVTARLPADNLLTMKTPLRVIGTGTAFDQTYYPTQVTRSMSIDDGYTMTVHAKNSNPNTTTSTGA